MRQALQALRDLKRFRPTVTETRYVRVPLPERFYRPGMIPGAYWTSRADGEMQVPAEYRVVHVYYDEEGSFDSPTAWAAYRQPYWGEQARYRAKRQADKERWRAQNAQKTAESERKKKLAGLGWVGRLLNKFFPGVFHKVV